jgi:hypothetical protein
MSFEAPIPLSEEKPVIEQDATPPQAGVDTEHSNLERLINRSPDDRLIEEDYAGLLKGGMAQNGVYGAIPVEGQTRLPEGFKNIQQLRAFAKANRDLRLDARPPMTPEEFLSGSVEKKDALTGRFTTTISGRGLTWEGMPASMVLTLMREGISHQVNVQDITWNVASAGESSTTHSTEAGYGRTGTFTGMTAEGKRVEGSTTGGTDWNVNIFN